jgi:1-deoxy-D-xylulose-5-phosphate reductoisomerase
VVAVARATVAQDLQLAFYAEAQRGGYAKGEFRVPKILTGPDAATELAGSACDVVLNGITGSVGLRPTLAALEAGTTLALANKESLVVGGPLVTARAEPGQIVAVDSEHSAIAQCLRGGSADEVRRLVLTASGGPFRGRPRSELAEVTVEQALAHPNFAMGPVITVNSATLVNKGLELIEAHLLFGIPMDRVGVVVHPQQAIHSMVEFVDGSTLAQVSPPDMTLPIALGLGWPDRLPDVSPPWDWTTASRWDFEPLDDEAFPAVRLAREAGTAGGTAPAVFNAANEECVEAFLAGRLPFLAIVDTVERVLTDHRVPSDEDLSIDDVLAAEAWARARARELTGTQETTPA